MSSFRKVGLIRKRQSLLLVLVVVVATVVDGLVLVPCDVGNGVDGCGSTDGDDGGWIVCAAVRWVVTETDKGDEENDEVAEVVVWV